jgi:hypothetical protein
VLAGNFENSYYAPGKWGRGAYFADDPNKSHEYVGKEKEKYMFLCKVILGRQNVLIAYDITLHAAGKDFDSVFADIPPPNYKEYIVYKYG